jgi:hypothetical protein
MKPGAIIFLEPKGTVFEVVRAAKKRGYHVVAFISDPTILETLPAPYNSAISCIDEVIPIDSWQEKENVVSAAERVDGKSSVKGVYSGLDACAMVCATLRKRFGLPSPDPEALELILNKCTLRWKLRQFGLSKLENIPGSIANRWDTWPLEKPFYFKPVHGAFSLNVVRCDSMSDFKKAEAQWETGAQDAPSYIRNYLLSERDYHLEEAFDGELLSVEAISSGGVFNCIGLTSRILYSKDPTVEMGSCFPYPHPKTKEIVELVRCAHEKLGFTDGPSHTEVIINNKDQMEIIDFNPRFIGADVLQSINFAYGIAIEETLLDWTIGRSPTIKRNEAAFSCIQYILPPQPLRFESVEFPKASEVKFHTSFIKPGTDLLSTDRQIDYIGCYLTVMSSFDSAILRSKELRESIKINDTLEGAY